MSAFDRAAEAHPPGGRRDRSKVDIFLDALAAVEPESAEKFRDALRDPGWSVNGLTRVAVAIAEELGAGLDPPRNKALTDWRHNHREEAP